MFEQLHRDARYRCQYFTFGHPAGKIVSIARLETIAGALRTFIQTHVRRHANAVLLVAHSIGGLISRRATLDLLDDVGADDLPIHGVLMYGTPNDGTALARIPLPLRVLQDIRHDSEFIETLNREWIGRVINGGNPAYNLQQRTDLLCRYVAGIEDTIVPAHSAAHLGYLGDVRHTNQDHTSLTKPRDEHHDGLLILKEFIDDARDRIAARRLLRGAIRATTATLATLKNTEWVGREHVTIQARRVPGKLHIRETTHRQDALCYDTFTLAVRLIDIALPTDRRIDYQHTIGPGLLTPAERQLSLNGVDSSALARRVTVRVSATINGMTHEYTALAPETDTTGYALLPFHCPHVPSSGTRAHHLRITLDTEMEEQKGWYSWRTRRVITDDLTVDWSAPFCITPRPHLQATATITPNTDAGDGLSATHIYAKGLIPPNASIDFIFERTSTYGEQTQ
jgi:hypothetical protein